MYTSVRRRSLSFSFTTTSFFFPFHWREREIFFFIGLVDNGGAENVRARNGAATRKTENKKEKVMRILISDEKPFCRSAKRHDLFGCGASCYAVEIPKTPSPLYHPVRRTILQYKFGLDIKLVRGLVYCLFWRYTCALKQFFPSPQSVRRGGGGERKDGGCRTEGLAVRHLVEIGRFGFATSLIVIALNRDIRKFSGGLFFFLYQR